MSHDQIILAWKDPAYRASLSEQLLSLLPSHPAGAIALSDPALQLAGGAAIGFRAQRNQWHRNVLLLTSGNHTYQLACIFGWLGDWLALDFD